MNLGIIAVIIIALGVIVMLKKKNNCLKAEVLNAKKYKKDLNLIERWLILRDRGLAFNSGVFIFFGDQTEFSDREVWMRLGDNRYARRKVLEDFVVRTERKIFTKIGS